jgi:hypothetical protein
MSEPEPPQNDEATALPLVGSWRWVYALVAASVVVWVALLILLQRMYS